MFDKNVLASVSLWHTCSAVVRFVMNPKEFQVRVLNPVSGFDGRPRCLELYVVAIGAFIDMCIELLYSTHLQFFVNGVLNPSHMNDFEHSGMLLMFFIFGVVALLSQQTGLVFVVFTFDFLPPFCFGVVQFYHYVFRFWFLWKKKKLSWRNRFGHFNLICFW